MGTPKKVAAKTVRAAVAAPAAKTAAPVAKQAGKFTVKVNQAARILTGKYAGAVGSVQSIDEENLTAAVLVQGIFNGAPIDTLQTCYPADLESAA